MCNRCEKNSASFWFKILVALSLVLTFYAQADDNPPNTYYFNEAGAVGFTNNLIIFKTKGVSNETLFEAYDIETGRQAWVYRNETPDPKWGFINNRRMALFEPGFLVMVSLDTGRQIWRMPVKALQNQAPRPHPPSKP